MARVRRSGWLALAVAVAALDLWTKALWQYPAGPPDYRDAVLPSQVTHQTVIDGWLLWHATWNPGGPWSTKLPPGALLWGTAIAVPLIAVWIFWPAKSSVFETVAKALVLGGAIGNLYDRWRWGQVRDWIDVWLWGWHYPTFNVADAGLVVGILILLLGGLRRRRPEAA